MFVVTEEDEAAIRAVYQQRGEFAAAIELRRRFPWHRRQRACAGVRAHHRWLEAAAAAAGEADAQGAAVIAGALMFRLRLPALAQSWQRGSASSHRD
jgi:hypothetical protein